MDPKNLDYKRNDKSSTEIELEIPVPEKLFSEVYDDVFKNVAKDVRVKGFRPGKAPKDMVESSHSKEILEETMKNVMPLLSAQIMKEEKIMPVAPLTYEIVSTDKPKNVKFKAVISVIPPFKLPNLKKIKIQKESTEVKDAEVDSFIKRLWQERKGKHKNMDDKWVKEIAPAIGFKVETLKDLKAQVKKAMEVEKERIVMQKYGSDILAEAVKMAGIEVPEAAVKFEAADRERSFNDQLSQMKVAPEQFCQIRGVTMEQLREQWEKDSKTALENDVFLRQYSEERKVEVTEDELKAEIDHILKQNKDQSKDLIDNERWRGYIRNVMIKRKSYTAFLIEVDSATFSAKPKAAEETTKEADKASKKK